MTFTNSFDDFTIPSTTFLIIHDSFIAAGDLKPVWPPVQVRYSGFWQFLEKLSQWFLQSHRRAHVQLIVWPTNNWTLIPLVIQNLKLEPMPINLQKHDQQKALDAQGLQSVPMAGRS